MSSAVYEDPAKTQMRGACEVAIEQAGYEVVAKPLRVKLPADRGLQGSLIGDIQSVDAAGRRAFYYVRPVVTDALPKWLGNLARASHILKQGDFYVVVREFTAAFQQACEAAGAGLLRLNEDNVFEVIVDYSTLSPASVEGDLEARLADLRRAMERKIDLQRSEIEERYKRVARVVSDMDFDVGDSYMARVEREYKALEDWGFELSRRLDEAASSPTDAVLTALDELISAGSAVSEEGAA